MALRYLGENKYQIVLYMGNGERVFKTITASSKLQAVLIEQEYKKQLGKSIDNVYSVSAIAQSYLEHVKNYQTAIYPQPENLTLEKMYEAIDKIDSIKNDKFFTDVSLYGMGMRIIETTHATTETQFRFPKTKKKRIMKKWSKKQENLKQMPCMYLFNGEILCHESIDIKRIFKCYNIGEQ